VSWQLGLFGGPLVFVGDNDACVPPPKPPSPPRGRQVVPERASDTAARPPAGRRRSMYQRFGVPEGDRDALQAEIRRRSALVEQGHSWLERER